MESIKLLARNGQAVRQALELGEILHMETASEELTDEFLIFAIKSGLLKAWAASFPDPRQWSAVSMEVILAASIAARFARLYSLRKTGYVLRSARVLGELGYAVEVLEAGDGLSARGTQDDSLISGDVIRWVAGQVGTAGRNQRSGTHPGGSGGGSVSTSQSQRTALTPRRQRGRQRGGSGGARPCGRGTVGRVVQPQCRLSDA